MIESALIILVKDKKNVMLPFVNAELYNCHTHTDTHSTVHLPTRYITHIQCSAFKILK